MKKRSMAPSPRKQKNQRAILKWAKAHGRLPNYKAEAAEERHLGQRLENYLSRASGGFDAAFRKLVYSRYKRRQQYKRTHDPKARLQELEDFMSQHHRTPSVKASTAAEKRAYKVFDNYIHGAPKTAEGKKIALKVASLVRKIDKCHNTRIAKAYRTSINLALGSKKLKKETID